MTMAFDGPIRVMLLDDHPVVRQGLLVELEKASNLVVAGSFETSRQMMQALAHDRVNVVLVDYSLGPHEVDGVNLIRTLRLRHPTVEILVVSGHYNPATVALAFRAGARGYVGKSQPIEEMIEAIRTVSAHRRYVDPSMAYALNRADVKANEDADEDGDHSLIAQVSLSPREQEVLRCVLDGMSVTQIANKFSRSVNTISTQKQAAFRKLGIRSDTELFKMQHQLG